jgi:hypothetical protein
MRDEYVDEIMTSLKIIGSIKEGQKVCVRNGLLTLETNSSSLQSSFWRWVYRDNRFTTLHYIKNIVHNALAYAKIAKEPDDIIRVFEDVLIGLQRLEVTYSADVGVCSNLQVLQERIKKVVIK